MAAPSLPPVKRTTTVVIGYTPNFYDVYNLGRQLGTAGQYGRAHIATKKRPVTEEDKQDFAVKIVKKARLRLTSKQKEDMYEMFRAEIKVMRMLRHPNIIKFYEVFEDDENIYIVMEFCGGGELFDRITASGGFKEKDAARILRQILEGLSHMHGKGIAHCDLKPDNFLFKTKEPEAPLKIIDFGMSKLVDLRRRNYFQKFCGTPYYVAPEVIQGRYREPCDMWSCGVVLFVMLHGYPPFYADPKDKNADRKIYELIQSGFYAVEKDGYGPHFSKQIPISPAARSLIARMLVKDPEKRITAEEALEDPWVLGTAASDVPIPMSVLRSIERFQRTNRFKQHVVDIMSRTLSKEEAKDVQKAFQTIDENKDGVITVAELAKVMLKVDKSLTKEDVERMHREADLNGDGVLSANELMNTYVQRALQIKEDRLALSFQLLDRNGDGKISEAELRDAIVQSGGELSAKDADDLRKIISEADKDGDGHIDYEEFLTQWMQRDERGGV